MKCGVSKTHGEHFGARRAMGYFLDDCLSQLALVGVTPPDVTPPAVTEDTAKWRRLLER